MPVRHSELQDLGFEMEFEKKSEIIVAVQATGAIVRNIADVIFPSPRNAHKTRPREGRVQVTHWASTVPTVPLHLQHISSQFRSNSRIVHRVAIDLRVYFLGAPVAIQVKGIQTDILRGFH